MAAFWLRIEGQNFAATLFDTEDLSTRRGASLALLNLPDVLFAWLEAQGFAVEPVYTGASEGVAQVTCEDSSDLEQCVQRFLSGEADQSLEGEGEYATSLKAVLPYLCICHHIEPKTDDYLLDMRVLANKMRRKQMVSLNFPPLQDDEVQSSVRKPCHWDGVRPGLCKLEKGDEKQAVSQSVFARRCYGTAMRQAFYKNETTVDFAADFNFKFVDSLHEMVDKPPEGLADTLRHKIAVLYFDGNGFNEIRGDVAKGAVEEAAFSQFIKQQRRKLLLDVLTFLSKNNAFHRRDQENLLQLETLLWGGDEVMLAFPACYALDLLAVVEQSLTNGWGYQEHSLSHAVGLVIGHYKTPIRDLQRLAKGLADSAKDMLGGRDACYLQYEVFESIDVPASGIDAYREGRYATDQPEAFTLPFYGSGGWQDVLANLRSLKEQVPPSQLYNLLAMGAEKGVLDSVTALDRWRGEADAVLKRYGQNLMECLTHFNKDGHVFMGLVHAMSLWDYCDPFLPQQARADTGGEAA